MADERPAKTGGRSLKLLAVTSGTEGDTRPLAALCRGLIDAGHQVHLLADAATLSHVRDIGVPADALAGDIRATFENKMQDINRALGDMVNENSTAWLRQTIDAGQGCDAIIISGLTAFVGLSAAEALGVLPISTMLFPLTPTAEFSSPLAPFEVCWPFKRLSGLAVNEVTWRVLRTATNEARTAAGLPPRRSNWSGHTMLYGFSPALVPPPKDWEANQVVTGQWTTPEDRDWAPPPDLLKFLDDGEPPVYIGFGSMGKPAPHVLEALIGVLATRRVLFYTGWSGIDVSTLPSDWHVVGPTPHSWLFPRTSVVIHHGGSGTTHSACRAGVPCIVLPFAGDQFFWAARVRAAGVSNSVLWGNWVTTAKLTAALEFAESAQAKEAANKLGEKMREEHGVAKAVEMIESMMADGARTV